MSQNALLFRSQSPEETARLAERLGRRLAPGSVVALYGELGSGKTCFIQGLVRGLGVPDHASSPTFVLIHEYRGRHPVSHVDCYRVSNLEELLDLGIEELLDGDGVTVIEWAERLEPLLPSRTVRVWIEGVGDEPREIQIQGAESNLLCLLGHPREGG